MAVMKYQKMCALLLAGALTTGMAMPAFAAETKTEQTKETQAAAQPMTLEEIQQLVLKNNRLKTTLELNAQKVTAGMSAIEDGPRDLKDAQDDAAHARQEASKQAGLGKAGAAQIKQGAAGLGTTASGIASQVGGAIGAQQGGAAGAQQGSQVGAAIGEQLGSSLGDALGGLADISTGLLSGTVQTANAMEDIVDSVADRQRETLEDQQTELKNTEMDLNKTKEDWDNEALAVTQLLVNKTVQVEKGVDLLTKKQALLERVCQIEEKKQALGLSTQTDLSGKRLEVAEGAKQLQDAKDGLVLLKRQLNDLMGKELDAALNITPPELAGKIEKAPAYSEDLLKAATEKNYKLKTLRRDQQQAKEKANDTSKYDGQIKASRLDMELADVAMKDQEAAIANDLKKKLDNINAAAAEYQNKKDAYAKAKTEWQQQQVSAKLGLVSAVEQQGLQLQFEQKEMELATAAYAYDMAWAEYRMLMDGTTLEIYDTYKEKIG
ncbi:MAG: hypothetical protein IKI88_06305 [Anaerotignum sp.]|nr:hypothetical protein [Anaerotignum sp.]